jgi:hypothetical protein
MEFPVDVQDNRFVSLFQGDDRFGIDVTNKAFKDTEVPQCLPRSALP